ncbi:MAG: efflux RND transporter periplasmic adaptor subunit [Dinghuibacter sp.]|nr:efflux RND transporter periplasmic adaptor subunit [Dinghuibacter sp.]
MKNKKISKWWWVAAAAVVLALVAMRTCKKDNTPRVSVEKIKKRDITETVEGTGKINPVNEMKISADAGSLVTDIFVKEGDTVKKGQVIAVILTSKTTASAGAARSKPDIQKLISSGGMNPAAIAEAIMNNQQTPAPVISTRQVAQNITAPMNGIISSIQVKKGERLMGTDIARISSAGEWEIRTDVGEVDIVKIREGNLAEIEPDAFPGAKLTGTVHRIASGGTLNGALPGNMYSDLTAYRVYIRVDAAAIAALKDTVTGEPLLLRSGMNTTLSIQTRVRSNVWAAPIKSVTTRLPENNTANDNGKTKRQRADVVVFAVQGNKVVQKKVTTGIQDMNYIEITGGLTGNEEIVSEPYELVDKTLANGMKVKVVDRAVLFGKQ